MRPSPGAHQVAGRAAFALPPGGGTAFLKEFVVRTHRKNKRREILEAAMPVFLARGFKGTIMSDVAKAAGGSKQTLYKYFRSKEELFLAVLNEMGTEIIHAFVALDREDFEPDFRLCLKRIGTQFLSAMNIAEIIAFRRIVIAEGTYSGLGRQIYETGAKRGLLLIAGYFETLMTRRVMRTASSWDAAVAFAALLEAGELNQFLEGARGPLTSAEIERRVDAAVTLFASHYAIEKHRPGPTKTPVPAETRG